MNSEFDRKVSVLTANIFYQVFWRKAPS